MNVSNAKLSSRKKITGVTTAIDVGFLATALGNRQMPINSNEWKMLLEGERERGTNRWTDNAHWKF